MQFHSSNKVLAFAIKFRKKHLFLLLFSILATTTDNICQTKTLTTTIAVSSRSSLASSQSGNAANSRQQLQDSKCANKTVSECATYLFALDVGGIRTTTPMPMRMAASNQVNNYLSQAGVRPSDATYKALSSGYKYLQHDAEPDLVPEQPKLIPDDAGGKAIKLKSHSFVNLPSNHLGTNTYPTTATVLFGDRTVPSRATTTKPTKHLYSPILTQTTAAAQINVRWPESEYVPPPQDKDRQVSNSGNNGTYGHLTLIWAAAVV